MPAGIDKIVPEPHLRANLIRTTHVDTGPFEIKKTYSLLRPVYTWAGMYEQVRFKVRACASCNRVKASFEVRETVLKPLSIMGLFYRWGVNLCKMSHTSEDGNKYVVVMIEHFTKWVELVEKLSFYTAAALKGVLTRFGAPAEVLTDQGEDFQGEFATLLQKLLIDHRTTSRDHPQFDGLAERMVQVVKEALQKYCLTFNKQHWCRFLCWIAMGYHMSHQRSLGGYSPYFVLFGRSPIVGASVIGCPAEGCGSRQPGRVGTVHQRACRPRSLRSTCRSRSTTWRWLSIEICCGTPRRGPERLRQSCSGSLQETSST
jgi:hypothetical protein